MMLEQWTISLDNRDSTQTPDVEALAALDSLLAYGPEYFDTLPWPRHSFARIVADAKVEAHNARN